MLKQLQVASQLRCVSVRTSLMLHVMHVMHARCGSTCGREGLKGKVMHVMPGAISRPEVAWLLEDPALRPCLPLRPTSQSCMAVQAMQGFNSLIPSQVCTAEILSSPEPW